MKAEDTILEVRGNLIYIVSVFLIAIYSIVCFCVFNPRVFYQVDFGLLFIYYMHIYISLFTPQKMAKPMGLPAIDAFQVAGGDTLDAVHRSLQQYTWEGRSYVISFNMYSST